MSGVEYLWGLPTFALVSAVTIPIALGVVSFHRLCVRRFQLTVGKMLSPNEQIAFALIVGMSVSFVTVYGGMM